MIIHFIGLGGSGKTTVAKLLSKKLDIQCFDLDEYFIDNRGDISFFINQYGYDVYAKCNVELYMQLKQSIEQNKLAILVCSSGFMTYRNDIASEYLKIIQEIENDDYTFLLMPAFDLNECCKIIIKRQLSRSYLNTTAEKEELKFNKRFAIYNNMNCRKILTNCTLDEIIQNISLLISSNLKFYDQKIE